MKTTPLLLFFLLLAFRLHAASVTLAWDANTESDLVGYRLIYGSVTGSYTATNTIVGRTNTITTVTNIGSGKTYFAVLAFDTSGLESDPSNEVGWTNPPAIPESFVAVWRTNGLFISWSASPDIAVAGYQLMSGTNRTIYTVTNVIVGRSNNVIVLPIEPPGRTFFAVSSFTSDGTASGTAELVWENRPATPKILRIRSTIQAALDINGPWRDVAVTIASLPSTNAQTLFRAQMRIEEDIPWGPLWPF